LKVPVGHSLALRANGARKTRAAGLTIFQIIIDVEEIAIKNE
jgi:hypothetical protein